MTRALRRLWRWLTRHCPHCGGETIGTMPSNAWWCHNRGCPQEGRVVRGRRGDVGTHWKEWHLR